MPGHEKTLEAVDAFNALHSGEVNARVLREMGRMLEVCFGGIVAESCCAYDYFDDLGQSLTASHGTRYSPWDWAPVRGDPWSFLVKYARIDFKGDLEKVIAKVRPIVDARIAEFREMGNSMDPAKIFSELCFCILTANYTAEGGIRIQKSIEPRLYRATTEELASLLKSLGHRFPNTRARFICRARDFCPSLAEALKMDDQMARNWLVKNIKGIGYKEASHFLRNIGRMDVAIIDRHILRFLHQMELIDAVPRSLSRKRYLACERLLRAISRELGVSLAELDLYLWYLMTGKILK